MAIDQTTFGLALAISAFASVPLFAFVWTRRDVRGALPLATIVVGSGLWSLGTLLPVYLPGRVAWFASSLVVYVGIALCVVGWPVFAAEYTGFERYVTPGNVALLSVEPVVALVLAATNGYHHLVWAEVVRSDTATGFAIASYGPWFWVHAGYIYLVMAVGVVLAVGVVYRRRDRYRGQATAVAVAAFCPWVPNAVYLTEVVAVDVTPIGFSFMAGVLLFAMVRYDLMDVTPVARNTVVDNIDDLVFVVGGDGRVIDSNPAADSTFAGENRTIVGERAVEAFADRPELRSAVAGDAPDPDELVLDGDERRRHFDVEVSPLRDRRNRTVGRLFLLHDVTDQKRRQAELARQNEQLDQFASLVSHDLRNPLTVARGYLDAAKGVDDVEAATEYLEEVDASHDRMQALVSDVLTLAREGQSVDETRPVDVPDLARDAWRNVDTADADLSVDTDATVEADSDRLLRAFENLFRNALDHGPPDVTVTVGESAAGDAPPDDGGPPSVDVEYARTIYVADDGPGIPDDRRDEVFSDGFTTAEDGTGLGLSIVQNVVEAHGWNVDVTESADGGARFELVGVDETTTGGGSASGE